MCLSRSKKTKVVRIGVYDGDSITHALKSENKRYGATPRKLSREVVI